ncbi:MAG: homocysteine S-methyltransferase family protein [Oscillospiraceae bacterium]|nr:homocysteine S-methyltransferase family protein [Oscillospiraceae bacterium]
MDITDVPLPSPCFIGESFGNEAQFDIVCVPVAFDDDAEISDEAIKKSVDIARSSAADVFVAGQIAPVRCEDDEGNVDFFDTFSAYFKQARALYEAGVDLLFADAMRSVADARAAVLACKRFDIPVFVTVSVECADITESKSRALAALICLQEIGASACGIAAECEIGDFCEIISELAHYAKVPLIARIQGVDSDSALELIHSGAQIISGFDAKRSARLCCEKCGISEHFDDGICEGMLVLSNETQSFFLSPDNIEMSEYIQCSQDMSDILVELGDTSTDIIGVELFSPDDAVLFMKNVHMASLPVIFKSQSITALTTALILYPGRACIDSCCEVEGDVLSSLAQKYGAIVY